MTTKPTNSDGKTFEQWTLAANRYCERVCGMNLDDLPDGPQWDSWHDDVTPIEYVKELLAGEGFEA